MDITILGRLVNGYTRNVDISANTLVVTSIKVGGVTNTELTKAILDRLVLLQNGSDVDATYHTHNTIYHTKTVLASTTVGSSGAKQIGVSGTPVHYTAATADVQAHLSGIDSALGTASSALDGTFRIQHTTDLTKQIAFDASGITTGLTRSLKMADANVDLANLTNSNISVAAAIALSKLAALTINSALVSDASGVISASAVTSTELGYLSGVTSAIQTQINSKLNLSGGTLTGALDLGSNNITSSHVPVAANDLTNKTYVDNAIAGLTWKNAVRAASVANINIASAPAIVDGVTLAANDRILLKDQTAPAENGIYVFTAALSPLTRALDMDAWIEVVGSVMLSVEGTVNIGAKWVNTNAMGGTLDTTAIGFTAFSVAGMVNGTGTANQVAYWTGAATLAGESFLATSRGGLGVSASAFTGVLKFAAGVASASTIVNADIDAAAAIAYSKLALTGSIVNADVATAAAIAYSKLALTGAVVNADIAAAAAIAYSKLALTGSIVNADIATAAAISYSKLVLANSISNNDLATTAADQYTIVGGNGVALHATHVPAVVGSETTNELLAANTLYAVRYGKAADVGFIAGRVVKADYDATTVDNFHVIGIAYPSISTTVGSTADITKHGILTATAHGFTIGEPIYLSASGAITSTAPATVNQAIVKLGMVKDANTLDIQIQVIGVN